MKANGTIWTAGTMGEIKAKVKARRSSSVALEQ